MGNYKDALTDTTGLIDEHYWDYPRHQGTVDMTEVIEMARIADEHSLTDKQYNKLIDATQEYFNNK